MTRITAVKTFLAKDAPRPIEMSEMMAFWKACSEEERAECAQSAATQLGVTLDGA